MGCPVLVLQNMCAGHFLHLMMILMMHHLTKKPCIVARVCRVDSIDESLVHVSSMYALLVRMACMQSDVQQHVPGHSSSRGNGNPSE